MRRPSRDEGEFVRHRKPRGRHLGRHRAAAPPRSTVAAVATTAVVGVGVVAIGAGSAFPSSSPADASQAAGALELQGRTQAVAAPIPALGVGEAAAVRQARAAIVNRASRSQTRLAAPRPAAAGWTRPAQGPITSLYGPRWGRLHAGVDIGAKYGTTVRAAYGGVVKVAGYSGEYGYLVTIDHGDGLMTNYGHNSELLVQVGQKVRPGMPIAKVGSTGRSTGPHSHFEVLVNGERVDPISYLRKRGLDLVAGAPIRTDL